jgi:tungstate transport system ATP-binding protein
VLPLVFEDVQLRGRGGVTLLADLSFRIGPGTSTVVLGPNGAGKTLLLRLANGLLRPTRGRVGWEGPGGARAAEARALVFQRPVLLRRSVASNVDYALRVRGVARAERRRRRTRVLEATGLAALARRPARLLSGGEQQRVALARAWAQEPQVLFLDEPAAGLDPAAQIALERAIGAVASGGTKIVMTTHDLGQARRMAGEILFLHRGRLLEQGPAPAFFEDPRTAEAKAFLRGDIVP